MYANCAHCELSIRVPVGTQAPQKCPRCGASHRTSTSPLPYRVLIGPNVEKRLRMTRRLLD